MKVELEREDWEAGLKTAVQLLKNALAQVEIYKLQVEMTEKKLAEFPEEQKRLNFPEGKKPVPTDLNTSPTKS